MDQVVLVLPRNFPHKDYADADFAQRAHMLRVSASSRPHLSAATSEGGLFHEIAQECRAAYGPDAQLALVCGRDAADRFVTWDYGDPHAIDRMLEVFQLLVASRPGPYEPPAHLQHRIRTLAMPDGLGAISASDVRHRIRAGLAWEHLVPPAIVPMVREIYRPPAT
jgi:nicotinic acid mononucleotide adenylyltransferase